MKKGRILLLTPNLKGVADGVNRIGPSLGLMLIAQPLIDSGHVVKIHDMARVPYGIGQLFEAVGAPVSTD